MYKIILKRINVLDLRLGFKIYLKKKKAFIIKIRNQMQRVFIKNNNKKIQSLLTSKNDLVK